VTRNVMGNWPEAGSEVKKIVKDLVLIRGDSRVI
jgi:hypothetical protein